MAHLLYDPDELAGARVIAVLVPGALARMDMFDAALAWREKGYGIATYRFPGLDGRHVTPPLKIAEAAAEIVALSKLYPDKPFRLLGYSTGGPIVISAAAGMEADLKVAVMSSAVENGGGLATGWRGFIDIIRCAFRARSLSLEAIWFQYYRVLLFGRAVFQTPQLNEQAMAFIDARRERIVLPDGGKPRAHTDDLRKWRLPEGVRFEQGQVQFFWGTADPVFSHKQTVQFAQKVGNAPVIGYPAHGHLLFASHEPVFKDILAFFEGEKREESEGVDLPVAHDPSVTP